MKCDQCDSAYINGVFCHEHGCPNANKVWDKESEMWVSVYECSECGEMIPEGESCPCQELCD